MGIAGKMFERLLVVYWDMMQNGSICLAGHEMSSASIVERDDRVAMLEIWVMWITERQLQSR